MKRQFMRRATSRTTLLVLMAVILITGLVVLFWNSQYLTALGVKAPFGMGPYSRTRNESAA